MCHFAHFLAIKVLLFGTEGRHFLALTLFRGACATQIQMILTVLLLHRQVVSSPPFVPPRLEGVLPRLRKGPLLLGSLICCFNLSQSCVEFGWINAFAIHAQETETPAERRWEGVPSWKKIADFPFSSTAA